MAAALNVVGLIALIVFGEDLLRFLPTQGTCCDDRAPYNDHK
jgi:hypothetical protein